MNYLSFHNQFASQDVVSTNEIQKAFPQFDTRRLVEWQQKGYIERLANRWYRFRKPIVDEQMLWWAANRIYQPSYVSLETALSHYGLIPEGVFSITSVSTRKTQTLTTPLGTFTYRSIKPALYFGYDILRWQDRPVLMANVEKVLLDVCYLRPELQSEADFDALRLNVPMLISQLNKDRLADYQQLVNSSRLNQRICLLLDYLQNHA
ncbi:MAG: hypothetical protein EOO39_22185 [Cytophagaceae bacterium]|nr:MAG: hypothetical protein EOO39_22185 [Cytophagaceae bacterium]